MRAAAFAAFLLALACVFAGEPALAHHIRTHVGVAVGFGYPYWGPWSPKGYYPYVKECPSGWERVPPAPPK